MEYPSAAETLAGARAFEHNPKEVAFVRRELIRRREHSPYHLIEFGKAFAKRFLPMPTRIVYAEGARDLYSFSHRRVQLGTQEITRLLHELGHAKYGRDEHIAVFYSVGLIMKALPGFVPDLTGHVLNNDPYPRP